MATVSAVSAHGIRVHRPHCADIGPEILQCYGLSWNQQKFPYYTEISLWLGEDPADGKVFLGCFLCEQNLNRFYLTWARRHSFAPFTFRIGKPPYYLVWQWWPLFSSGSISYDPEFPLSCGVFWPCLWIFSSTFHKPGFSFPRLSFLAEV